MTRDEGAVREGSHDGPVDGPVDEAPGAVRNPFRRVWWLPVLRGIVFIVLGLLLMIEPLEELEILRLLIGAFLAADGVLVLVQWLVHRRQVGSAWWLAQAGVNVVFGAVVALWPGLDPTPLYYVLAVWTIVLGIVAIIGGAALSRNRDLGWPWMVTFGITAALFGMLLVTRPLDSLDVLRLVAIVFALFAFVAGSVNIVSGFAVRSVARELRDLREQAEKVGVVVTGGSVLGAANPHAAPARAAGPRLTGDAPSSAADTGETAPTAGPAPTTGPEASGSQDVTPSDTDPGAGRSTAPAGEAPRTGEDAGAASDPSEDGRQDR